MTQLLWDQPGDRVYETGVDRGVLFVGTDYGVAWNGLVSVTESPTGGEATNQYSDNRIYARMVSGEQLGGTIEAFTFPPAFERCDGMASPDNGFYVHQQNRAPFALTYRTRVGNDLEGTDYGYKIHLIYNALASPSEDAYATINDSPEPLTFSWDFTANPIDAGHGLKPTAYLVVDSTKANPDVLQMLEEKLYGTSTTDPTLLTPTDVIGLFASVLQMTFDATSGYYQLYEGGLSDLLVTDDEGEYQISDDSRLSASSIDGIYNLEV